MSTIEQYLSQNSQRFEDELCDLLRIASVSADSKHKADVRSAANWVLKQFQSLGLQAELIETAGHPLVYAESPAIAGAPTVLVYGHYDVQPPDPLNEWISPPFEPTRRDGNIYARGATDDKGQMFTHVKSAEAWLKTAGKLPVQLKFLIEGEEEVGSDNLYEFVAANKKKLAMRRGRNQRLQSIWAWSAGNYLRAARTSLFRIAADRSEARPALRDIWRSGRESGNRTGENDGRLSRPKWPHSSAGIL